MNTSSGLSSNTSKSTPTMKLDSATREGILAKNQARLLTSLGVTGNDAFDSGGLNPLKGLYSAAAATFLKNKQGRTGIEKAGTQTAVVDRATGSVKSSASAKATSPSSTVATRTQTTGPNAGGDYKKYAWNGTTGPTGRDDVLADENDNDLPPTAEAEPVTPAQEPKAETANDDQEVFDRLSTLINDNGGSIADDGNGGSEFKVLDLQSGNLRIDGDTVRGSASGSSGTYTFTVNKAGDITIDSSSGDQSSAEYEQVRGLLAGSLTGVRRNSDPAPAPAPTPTPTPAPTPAPAAGSVEELIGASAAAMASLLATGKADDKARVNARIMVEDVKKAGGQVRVKDDKTLSFTLNGQSGELALGSDRVTGSLGAGSTKIDFVVRNDGRLSINGDDDSAQAVSNSKALRRAFGASTIGDGFRTYDVAKFNRNGGLGSLLSLLG